VYVDGRVVADIQVGESSCRIVLFLHNLPSTVIGEDCEGMLDCFAVEGSVYQSRCTEPLCCAYMLLLPWISRLVDVFQSHEQADALVGCPQCSLPSESRLWSRTP
jgi:hypothetical protein